MTKELHFQVHPCGICELFVDPLPEGVKREGALYPDGAHITDLKEVRGLIYKMQRPAIAPGLVYPHDWKEKDLVLFITEVCFIVSWGHSSPRLSARSINATSQHQTILLAQVQRTLRSGHKEPLHEHVISQELQPSTNALFFFFLNTYNKRR